MRSATTLLLLLPLALVLPAAHADTLDHFSVTSTGFDIEFSTPASVTVPDSLISNQYISPGEQGTFNGLPATVSVHLTFPGPCSVCDTLFLNVTPTAGAATTYEFGLPTLYQLTFPTTDTVTLTFLPGSYTTTYFIRPPFDNQPANITITAETTATTPEPPTLSLIALALLLTFSCRRRFITQDHT